MGDFNQIEFLSQNSGGSDHIPGKEQFPVWRNLLRLSELSFHGQPFTWCNNRLESDRIYERLDRAYASEDWIHRHPEATLLILPILVSDHSPILLYTSPNKLRRKTQINLEAWCLGFAEVATTVTNHWNKPVSGSPMYQRAQKCRHIRYDLFKWCKNYKKQNNIQWRTALNQCGNVQANIPFNNGGDIDEKLKKENIEKLELQLKY
ncbi:uncharacterized protein LOC104885106 [Beta vulgaris subsp. vulgaris]|uniref:uncharacterized protein LOC104885106 n=1 Tax=Beta vulgaris subsp. vulgaris TaxID=3555 RepID=UPI00053F6BD0|nr:uncharacterized protein LOC104885106 [Beta vulgaris subsp. vulgaris]